MKQTVLNWIMGGAGALVASAAARALPEPQPLGSRFYLWLYRFVQNVLANFDKSSAQK